MLSKPRLPSSTRLRERSPARLRSSRPLEIPLTSDTRQPVLLFKQYATSHVLFDRSCCVCAIRQRAGMLLSKRPSQQRPKTLQHKRNCVDVLQDWKRHLPL
jgi:hypothetical protein